MPSFQKGKLGKNIIRKGKATNHSPRVSRTLDSGGNQVETQSSFRIESVFHFKTYTSKISMLTHCQDLNTVLPAIVSTKQMASVQVHKLRQCILKPFLPALWLVVAAGAPGQRRWPQWVALPPPYLKLGTRGPRHPPGTTALVGPLLKSLCMKTASPTKWMAKPLRTPARPGHHVGCPVGGKTTVPLLQPPQREQNMQKKKIKIKPRGGFCCEVLN